MLALATTSPSESVTRKFVTAPDNAIWFADVVSTVSRIRSATCWAMPSSTPVNTTTISELVQRTTKSLPRTAAASISSMAGESVTSSVVTANRMTLAGS